MKDIASRSFQCGLCEKRIDFGQDFYHHARDGRILNVCSICSSLMGYLGTWSREFCEFRPKSIYCIGIIRMPGIGLGRAIGRPSGGCVLRQSWGRGFWLPQS